MDLRVIVGMQIDEAGRDDQPFRIDDLLRRARIDAAHFRDTAVANGEVATKPGQTGGALTAWVLSFCPALWLTCAVLSSTLDPNLIKLLHTAGWFIYDVTFMITTVQLTGLGLYTILNKRQSIFPAWAGWCAIAIGIIFLPLVLIPFVDKGPFMLPGTWNFYIVFSTWLFGFFTPYSYFMLKELMARRREFLPGAVALGR